MEYYYQLEIWKGNINGVLRVARQREELSDWLVAMAPMGELVYSLPTRGELHKESAFM